MFSKYMEEIHTLQDITICTTICVVTPFVFRPLTRARKMHLKHIYIGWDDQPVVIALTDELLFLLNCNNCRSLESSAVQSIPMPYVGEAMLKKSFAVDLYSNLYFINKDKKTKHKKDPNWTVQMVLLPAGQFCLHPWGQIKVHQLGTTAHPYFISPLNPAAVVEQHHSECNSISKWTVWVMLMVVSIALGVYPQAALKPLHPAHASELFFSSIFGPNSNSSDIT